MSWMEQINPATAVWHGVEAYAEERIAELTVVCIATTATEQEIRVAQAGIQEMNALLAIPGRLKLRAEQAGNTDRTKGY